SRAESKPICNGTDLDRRAQRNVDFSRDARQQSSSFARWNQSLRRSPNSKENERISTRPFLFSHFSPGNKIENCSAQFLPVCWTVHVEFKLHRLRDGFSVSNALLLDQ